LDAAFFRAKAMAFALVAHSLVQHYMQAIPQFIILKPLVLNPRLALIGSVR
jgi:hypothetical protein